MSLRDDAIQIWRAGVDAVRPEKLLPGSIRVEPGLLTIEDARGDTLEVDLGSVSRVLVVGGGKAGAGMARGFEAALGPSFLHEKRLTGLLSVPEDCLTDTQAIRLVSGRPPGVNEPRPEGETAAREMLRLVAEAGESDLVVCLLSGGGSALLPVPSSPMKLEDKVLVARLLAARGATIEQLNTVRQHLSDFKGGALARACRAPRLITLAISDVLGDPLDLIASGPTVQPDSTPRDALAVLESLGLENEERVGPIADFLRSKQHAPLDKPNARCDYVLLANNAMAVDAAGMEAERLGYNHAMQSASASEGAAEEVGRHLADMAIAMRDSEQTHGPNCLISGGEPTVTLAPEAIRGRGGRNQQLMLAAMQQMGDCRGMAVLSGGADGEDGPTDAAGAFADASIAREAATKKLNAAESLRRNDAYTFFEQCGGLLRTGPTHTNVCDLRVVLTGDEG